MELSLGISPCPNDTFIFGPLLLGKIDTHGVCFNARFLDVERLNHLALAAKGDVLKISAAAYGRVHKQYALLEAGGAMGYGCGPLLVSGPEREKCFGLRTIAVPGMLTTATLLLLRFLQGPQEMEQNTFFRSTVLDGKEAEYALVEMSYEKIIPALTKGEVDFGVIIHEGRFTYHGYGLKLVCDLGQWWEMEWALPIPLGVIIIRRTLGEQCKKEVQDLIRQSLIYSRKHTQEIWPFIKKHAQELDDQVISQHIQTFVNEFSQDLAPTGKQALNRLLSLEQRCF